MLGRGFHKKVLLSLRLCNYVVVLSIQEFKHRAHLMQLLDIFQCCMVCNLVILPMLLSVSALHSGVSILHIT